ncbi:MAG: polyisoprenyl-phosphate glycosyltransferase [Actinomycetota bacterium]|nr:polyisoprenyl-phosphate glycosyltransferase [Actinomycetota bacterium]
MRLSVVIPFLNEAATIPALYDRLSAVDKRIRALGVDLEIVLVDDGSTDESVATIHALDTASNPPVRLVRLSRNFGSYAAIPAGIPYASGDAVAFMSADLQDPPEVLVTMVEKWQAGHDLVFAVRRNRNDPAIGKLFSALYYRLMRRFAIPQMPIGGSDFCLADRKVIDGLGNLQERNSNLFCLLLWAGFKQCTIDYDREAREHGTSKWNVPRKIKLFIDSFAAFSSFPLRLISVLGFVLSFLGLSYAAVVVVRALFWEADVQGWSSLMVVVLLCSGVQLMMLGIISEYLWRAFDSARGRPSHIVWETSLVAQPRRQQPGAGDTLGASPLTGTSPEGVSTHTTAG